MCYLIAKRADWDGCIALQTEHGKQLIALKRKLTTIVGYEKVQLVTISRPSAYGEYAPYQFVETEEEFVEAVVKMK